MRNEIKPNPCLDLLLLVRRCEVSEEVVRALIVEVPFPETPLKMQVYIAAVLWLQVINQKSLQLYCTTLISEPIFITWSAVS